MVVVFFNNEGIISSETVQNEFGIEQENDCIIFKGVLKVNGNGGIVVLDNNNKVCVDYYFIPMWIARRQLGFGAITNGESSVYFLITDSINEITYFDIEKIAYYGRVVEWPLIDHYVELLKNLITSKTEKLINSRTPVPYGENV